MLDHETLEGRIAAFDAWSARKKKELGPFAGLAFGKTNVGGICFGRHWPHLLCWQWTIWLTPYRGRTFDGPRRIAFFGRRNDWYLKLWFFEIHWARQAYDRMAALGPRWSDAPAIYPRTKQDRARELA
ncbi:hypothetical protein [Caulobacter sp. X]|uniref:hypothetical protein n=1 Tax=Caulobacter sp. X TaxID=2048901 RepID=UPI00117760D9|nr:hypothetical protein [Caulobacter sp. X]